MNNNFQSWYDQVYPQLTGNGLWLRGNELNTVCATEFEARPFRILVSRLSTYFDVAESFSHKVLYQIARKQPDIFPDFSYLPPVNDIPVFERDSIPWLIGSQTKRGARDFDLIAFSNAIVLELMNLPLMLDNSGVPVKKSDRIRDKKIPLVILGGSNAPFASLFFVPDPPVDGIFMGESTQCVADIFRICADAKANNIDKSDTLKILESVPGFIQPDNPVHTKRYVDVSLNLNDYLINAPVSNDVDLCATATAQISEGCPCFCSFCAESFCHKPYREVATQKLVSDARKIKASTGIDKLELFSFNFNMHSDFFNMAGALARFMPHIGLKSQRFDMLAHDDTLLPFLLAAGKTSLTCGLEGISERLRNYLHKSLSTIDLDKSLSRILAAPLREIKIFLILTGLENDTDFTDFSSMLLFIKSHLSSSSRNMRLIFSATPLVRFPHTPLAAEDAPMPSVLKPIISKTKSLVETHGFEFRMSSDADDYCMSQILVRAYDNRIYEALAATMAETGFIMYRSVPQVFVNAFTRNLLSSGITVEACLLAGSGKPENPPWSYFDTGVSVSFITSQHESAKEYQDNGFCLGSADKTGECKACGACGARDAESRSAITAMRTAARYPLATFKESTKRWMANTTSAPFLVDICESKRGLPRSVIGTAIGRALMTTSPECVSFFGGTSHSLLANGTGTCWITGHDIITLKWRKEGLQHLELLMQKPEAVALVNNELAGFCTILSFNPQEPQEYELSITSPFTFSPNAYFVKHGLTYLLRKQNNGSYSFEFSKQALKKNLIRSFSYSIKQDGEFYGKMKVTRKFVVEDFLNEVFTINNQAEVVKIRATAGFN